MLIYNRTGWDLLTWNCASRCAIAHFHTMQGLILYHQINKSHPVRFCCIVPKIFGLFSDPVNMFSPISIEFNTIMFESAERFNAYVSTIKNQ